MEVMSWEARRFQMFGSQVISIELILKQLNVSESLDARAYYSS